MIKKPKSLIVVDWDSQETRYLWAVSSGKRTRIKALGKVHPIDPSEDDAKDDPTKSMLQDIKSILGLRRSDLAVLLPRTDIDESQASLPLAGQEEFNLLVANQAHEVWPESTELSIIDYYHLDSPQAGMQEITITALGIEKKKSIVKRAENSGLKVAALQLKHLNAINLLRDQVNLAQYPISILINLNSQNADLVIMLKDQIAVIRTIPMPTTQWTETETGRIKLELQRSLMMVRQPESNVPPASTPIFLFGDPSELKDIAQAFQRDSQYEVHVKNPLANFEIDRHAQTDNLHQFAALIGGVTEVDKRHQVDFVSPKCQRKFPAIYRRLITYGSVAAAVLIMLVYSGLNEVGQANQANVKLRQEIKKVEDQIADMKKRTAVVDYVKRWENEEVNWLEELRGLSLRFPSRDKAQVRSMTMSVNSNRRGVVSMSVRSRDESVISSLEQAIRDEYHQVRTSSLSQSSSEGDFGWQFNAAVSIVPRQKIDLDNDPVLAFPRSDSSEKGMSNQNLSHDSDRSDVVQADPSEQTQDKLISTEEFVSERDNNPNQPGDQR